MSKKEAAAAAAAAAAPPDTKEAILKFGDVIFLHTDTAKGGQGLLRAEGFSEDKCVLGPLAEGGAPPVKFQESLFRISPQLQYFAAGEYEAAAAQAAASGRQAEGGRARRRRHAQQL